jgi:hypothetical protein
VFSEDDNTFFGMVEQIWIENIYNNYAIGKTEVLEWNKGSSELV